MVALRDKWVNRLAIVNLYHSLMGLELDGLDEKIRAFANDIGPSFARAIEEAAKRPPSADASVAAFFPAFLMIVMEEETAVEEAWDAFIKQAIEAGGLQISAISQAGVAGLLPKPERHRPTALCCSMCGADLHGPFCSVCGFNNG